MNNNIIYVFFILLFCKLYNQNIKTIQLLSEGKKYFSPIVKLGNSIELSFDDLDGDNKEYQYKIEHMTYDWKLSDLNSNQYVQGFNQNTIINVSNSFNTIQNYTHYWVKIPNQNTIITKSGNYLISILDQYNNIIFSKRCVFYEQKAFVGVNVLRSKNIKFKDKQQTINFIINYKDLLINTPDQEIKVLLIKNFNWKTSIKNLKPQFYKHNQLIYNYTNKTNFWGGNEFRNFDSKNIRRTSLNIFKTKLKNIWNNYLYPDEKLCNEPYSYNPDINGQFVIRTIQENNPDDNADYAIIHFSLKSIKPYNNKEVYVYGGFNNFKLSNENKMTYDKKSKKYYCSIKLKQGFYNYSYATINSNKIENYNEIDGSFYQTENRYTVIVYYRPLGGIYDRAIGVGNGFFNQNK